MIRNELVFNNQIIEVAINCNICHNLQFLIFGSLEFTDLIVNQLHFLGIEKNQIRIQTTTNKQDEN